MGDDCWPEDGRDFDSAYRTISSLRELVGPQGSQRPNDESETMSLKGTRFRRTRCSEDPGYFVSTPLERFKITRRNKMEARKKLLRTDLSSFDNSLSDKSIFSPIRSDKFGETCIQNTAELLFASPSDKNLTGNDNITIVNETHTQNTSEEPFVSSSGMNSTEISDQQFCRDYPLSNESLKINSTIGVFPDALRIHPLSQTSSDIIGAKLSTHGTYQDRISSSDTSSRTATLIEDNSKKHSSPDRFRVSKTEGIDDINLKSDKSNTLSDSGDEIKCNQLNRLDNDILSKSLEAINDNSDNTSIRRIEPLVKEDDTKPERFKVTKEFISPRILDVGSLFLKDLPPFDVHSSPYRDLSGCPPRRRLSQCPEEDETEEEPTKRPVLPRLHMDKLFFDSSLVEMKSQASSSSTIDTIGSTEEVWIKRPESKPKQDVGADGSSTDGASTMSSTTSRGSNSDSAHSYRSAESTWGGGNPGRQMVALVTGRRHKSSGGRHSVYHTVTGAVGGTGPPRVQQTHIPSIFEVFRPRSKSDANANQKKPSLMGHVRNAMGGSGGKSAPVGDETVATSSGTGSRGPVAKVIHLFRNRSQSAASADEKRKARAAALQQQQQYATSVIRRSSLEKRRLSLGTVGGTGHRGSDPSLDPNHAAILFRDSRGLPVADPFLEKVNLSDLEEDESQIFVKFFRFHKCYDLIPTSAKLVVFDTQLLVKKAFFALVYNGVRAAPLWDSIEHKFVGMLTITDFIKILKMFYGKTNGPEWMQEMEAHKLDTWRRVLKDEARELVSIGPDASLYEAISILVEHRIHRLPVVDPETNNVLYILTHKRILRFLFLYINDLPRPSFMSKTLAELRVGTFQDVATAKQETTIISALDVFMDRRVSALPIVDEDNKLVDIYAKFDVINLAAEKTYDNLDVSLKEANEHRNEWFEGVHKCSMDDTLYTIIERIVRAEVHRLVVTDDEDRVIGVVSLSDILDYLVLKPAREDLTCRSESPSISESLAYSNTQEDTIAEGEEEDEQERSPSQTWSQPQWSLTSPPPLTSA